MPDISLGEKGGNQEDRVPACIEEHSRVEA